MAKMYRCFFYKWCVSGLCYIGRTQNIKARISNHKWQINKLLKTLPRGFRTFNWNGELSLYQKVARCLFENNWDLDKSFKVKILFKITSELEDKPPIRLLNIFERVCYDIYGSNLNCRQKFGRMDITLAQYNKYVEIVYKWKEVK